MCSPSFQSLAAGRRGIGHNEVRRDERKEDNREERKEETMEERREEGRGVSASTPDAYMYISIYIYAHEFRGLTPGPIGSERLLVA